MAEHSKIEWTDATWNPITGCSVVSPGCTNCYAMRQARRHDRPGSHYDGTTAMSKAGPIWTGKVALAPEPIVTAPLRWKRSRRIFVNSMGDLFHSAAPDWWRHIVFAVMALSYDTAATDENNVITALRQRHVYQVLTKRHDIMRRFVAELHNAASAGLSAQEFLAHPFSDAARQVSCSRGDPIPQNAPLSAWQWIEDGYPGLWLGVSVEDQTRADERIPLLLDTPAAVRFISAEPLLGPVDLAAWLPHLNWIIVGGESGPGARPMNPDWARHLRDDCRAAGVAFFMKQMSKKAPIPDDLFIREWPQRAP